MKKTLIIVDIQNDYFEGGKMPLVGADEAVNNASLALDYCRKEKWNIIHVQHIDIQNSLPFFQPNTKGVEIHKMVTPLPHEAHFVKHSPNAFLQTNLLKHLKEIKVGDLVVCGMMTHMCVDATVRAAKDYGFNIQLLPDACATTHMQLDDQTIDAMVVHKSFIGAMGQYYAEIFKTDQFIKQNKM